MHRIVLAVLTTAGLAATLAISNSTPTSTTVDSQQLSSAFGGIHPRISLDGTQIAVSYQGAIWRMPREGGTMTRLTDGAGFDVAPGDPTSVLQGTRVDPGGPRSLYKISTTTTP